MRDRAARFARTGRKVARLVTPLYLIVACTPSRQPSHQDGPVDTALRAELLRRVESDQTARLPLTKAQRGGAFDSSSAADLAAVDADNRRWIASLITARGWPGRTLVGADGADAAFMLVQHADLDTALQGKALPLLEHAFRMGEAEGQQVALLTDRVAVSRKQPQLYGTQVTLLNGRVVLKPLADSARVDARRAAMGLPTLAEYVRRLEMYYSPKSPP